MAGRYRLDERIAAGGMGEVWKGTDTRLQREVAIKILHAGLSGNDKFRTRFQLEARAVAALQSPGIVGLYDYGEETTDDDGLVSYLIMELVRGRSLSEILRDRGTLPPDEVMKIVATAADALETAHRNDIIHRDIKPANLLVDEATGATKIVDFGISAARGASGLTETGTVMGTLAYASPEQLNGAELTGASDLYSLGIVAYEALMGRPPFVSDTPVAVMNGHMTQAPPPLSRDIPAGIAQVVLQSLQKDPRARYTSAAEMARSAREGRVVTGGIPVSPATPPDGQQTQYLGSDQTALLGAGVGANTAEQPTGAMAQEEEKSSATPWLITAAVVAVLVIIGLIIWWDYTNGRDAEIKEPSETSSSAETSEEAPTSEAETTSDDDDDDDNWQPSDDEETSESPSETPSETASETQSESPSPESPEPTDPTTSAEPDPEPSDTPTEAAGGGGEQGN
ncbi:serine/threonine-protein kinase [Glycomyces tritici]|uniref:non-specific serine/threonine protein kinase n=1 Tax=Glycomyces tritici TaxID=2665176 RepID=A0ABT7YL22_9ACTN|nr:serine/threonine-protein kinase [Glycomyces tritici]MDN3239334.1 serine/threonine-protein kinase [Glycomyces tritici]